MPGVNACQLWLDEWLRISDGGDRLPSQAALCRRFMISKRSLKAILDAKANEGLLEIRPRAGAWRAITNKPHNHINEDHELTVVGKQYVATGIEAAFLAQEWPRHEPLPPIRWLAQRFGASSRTCGEALEILQQRRLIFKRGGRWYRNYLTEQRSVLVVEPSDDKWTTKLIPYLEAQLSMAGYVTNSCSAEFATHLYQDSIQRRDTTPHVFDLSCDAAMRPWLDRIRTQHGRRSNQARLIQIGQHHNVLPEILHCRHGSFRTARIRAVCDHVINKNYDSVTLLAELPQTGLSQIDHQIAGAIELSQTVPEIPVQLAIRTDRSNDKHNLFSHDSQLVNRCEDLLSHANSWSMQDLIDRITLYPCDATPPAPQINELLIIGNSLSVSIPANRGPVLSMFDNPAARQAQLSAITPNFVHFAHVLTRALKDPDCLPVGRQGRIRPPVTIIQRRSTEYD